jgi:hypothetical protein
MEVVREGRSRMEKKQSGERTFGWLSVTLELWRVIYEYNISTKRMLSIS